MYIRIPLNIIYFTFIIDQYVLNYSTAPVVLYEEKKKIVKFDRGPKKRKLEKNRI